jgi:hypothetical protein
MMSAHPSEKVVAAPEALGLETRGSFRRADSHTLDELPQGSGRLVIDLTATRAVDSAGLGALMLIQRHGPTGDRRSACAGRTRSCACCWC